jgi:hypothetical protein
LFEISLSSTPAIPERLALVNPPPVADLSAYNPLVSGCT